jgi:hypothetical protein
VEINILKEAGFDEALLGLSLNKNQSIEKMPKVALKLAKMDGGHNKFLESIDVWLDIKAPRYWWSQFDTYRAGVTKQSESTMHTIMKRQLTEDDFSEYIPSENIDTLNGYIQAKQFNLVKANLPEGFLQRRIVKLSYKNIRNIIQQRKNHRLLEWKFFCDFMLTLENYQFLGLK